VENIDLAVLILITENP